MTPTCESRTYEDPDDPGGDFGQVLQGAPPPENDIHLPPLGLRQVAVAEGTLQGPLVGRGGRIVGMGHCALKDRLEARN